MANIKVKEITLEGKCPSCGKVETRTLTIQEFQELQKGDKYIQEILSERTPEFREFFLSGICANCWTKMQEEAEEDGGEIGDLEDALG